MKANTFVKTTCSIALSAIIGAISSTAMADAGHGTAKLIGVPGKSADATRTIEVTMYDNYYEPENLNIKEGETVRFVVKNAGGFVHEFNIASPDMHKAHGPEMMMMLEHGVLEADKINWDAAKKMQASMGHGMHNDPNSVLLEPGKTGEIVWTFTGNASLEFACNVPGHYESGMVGQVKLTH